MNHAIVPIGKDAQRAERQVQALRLRQMGHTYRIIAEKLHVDVHTAHRWVDDALKDLAAQSRHEAESLRALELSRLDEYMLLLAPALAVGDLAAIDRALKINESRRKLLGIDVPLPLRSTGVQVTMTPDEIAALSDDELDRLITQLERAACTGTPAEGTSYPPEGTL